MPKLSLTLSDLTENERAIYAAAFTRCFFEMFRDKQDEERARLAHDEALALVWFHRRAIPK